MQRQQHETGDEPQLRRDDCRLGQSRDLLQRLQRVCTVVRAFDQCIEAELLGAPDELEIVCKTRPHVVSLRMLPADDQAEFHLTSVGASAMRHQTSPGTRRKGRCPGHCLPIAEDARLRAQARRHRRA